MRSSVVTDQKGKIKLDLLNNKSDGFDSTPSEDSKSESSASNDSDSSSEISESDSSSEKSDKSSGDDLGCEDEEIKLYN